MVYGVPMTTPFHSKLEEVEAGVVELGNYVVTGLPQVTLALLAGDVTAAEEIVKSDDHVNTRAEEIETLCHTHLALQKPNGPELRRTISSLRVVADLERSHDLVVNIAKATRRISGLLIDPTIAHLLGEMSRQATFEFKHAIDAYVKKDETLASSVMTTDSVLDATHQDLLQAIFTAHKLGNCEIEVALQVALVGRFIERIGDHAVNLSRSIHYTVTGEPGPDVEGAARREMLEN